MLVHLAQRNEKLWQNKVVEAQAVYFAKDVLSDWLNARLQGLGLRGLSLDWILILYVINLMWV